MGNPQMVPPAVVLTVPIVPMLDVTVSRQGFWHATGGQPGSTGMPQTVMGLRSVEGCCGFGAAVVAVPESTQGFSQASVGHGGTQSFPAEVCAWPATSWNSSRHGLWQTLAGQEGISTGIPQTVYAPLAWRTSPSSQGVISMPHMAAPLPVVPLPMTRPPGHGSMVWPQIRLGLPSSMPSGQLVGVHWVVSLGQVLDALAWFTMKPLEMGPAMVMHMQRRMAWLVRSIGVGFVLGLRSLERDTKRQRLNEDGAPANG